MNLSTVNEIMVRWLFFFLLFFFAIPIVFASVATLLSNAGWIE